MKKAAIYNPYLDTLGGGERYSMAVAHVLDKHEYKVCVQWKDKIIKKSLEERFGFNLSSIDFIPNINKGDGYDVCFWVSDGSVPLLRARNNILHFQIPFKNVDGGSLLNRMKMYRIKNVVCNSGFTKKIVDREYGIESKVVYPPVDTKRIRPKRKENLILSVGRFSQLTQAKRQDVLISAFKKLYDSSFNQWRMVLAGGIEVGVDDYLKGLKEQAEGYPIEIVESPKFREILDLYGRAKIFWSASGYGVDEDKDPQKVEHFGISLVEAMAAKVVPIVFAAGGHKEIVSDGEDGFLWKTTKQLISQTKKVIQDKVIFRNIPLNAQIKSKKYSYEEFEKNFINFI